MSLEAALVALAIEETLLAALLAFTFAFAFLIFSFSFSSLALVLCISFS